MPEYGARRWSLPKIGGIVAGIQQSTDATGTVLHESMDSLLANPERLLSTLVHEAKEYAIFLVDAGGRIVGWNPGAATIFGWTSSEILGQPVAVTFTEEDRARGIPEKERATATAKGRADDKRWHERKDGSRIFIDGFTAAIRDEDGGLQGFVKIGQDATERKQLEEKHAALAERELEAKRAAEEVSRRLYEAEREARNQAERNSRAKDELVAVLAHELRTPMAAIVGWTQLVRSRDDDHGLCRDAIEQIQNSANIQAALVDDMLEVSRIILGRFEVDLKPLRIFDVLRSAVFSTRPMQEEKGITLDVDIPEEEITILGDSRRLHQVFWNLLSNAIKFTPAGGTISVRSETREKDVEIIVSDTGEGIEPSQLSALLEHGTSQEGSKRAGLGLGLRIVKHIIAAHHGTLSGSSEGRGKGSQFTVTLPRPSVHNA